MPRSADLQAARQMAADLQHPLDAAFARCRELETLIAELNARLVQVSERAVRAETAAAALMHRIVEMQGVAEVD